MRIALWVVLFASCFALDVRGQDPSINDAPKPIRELAAEIQGKSGAQIRAAIGRRFGPRHRDVGSGLLIEQWDVAGGVLTFHPMGGPVFLDQKSGRHFVLLQTAHAVHAILFGSYEMDTLPDARGGRYWLGNVELGADMTYRFTDSGQHQDRRNEQANNFFMLHPVGTVEVRYVGPNGPDTILEKLADGAAVAQVMLRSADGKSQATLLVAKRQRKLEFSARSSLPFYLYKAWGLNLRANQ